MSGSKAYRFNLGGGEGKLYEYKVGSIKYIFEDVTINNRNSIAEFKQDMEVRSKMWHIAIGDFVIDIGAGFGSYTMISLAKAAGFVFAFEHDKKIAAQLRKNLQYNFELSASERATVCTWHLDDSKNTVDRFLSELSYPISRIDWIKIDLGNIPDNRLVLWGCKETIKRFRPNILLADPDPPTLSFLGTYKTSDIINGHVVFSDDRR